MGLHFPMKQRWFRPTKSGSSELIYQVLRWFMNKKNKLLTKRAEIIKNTCKETYSY